VRFAWIDEPPFNWVENGQLKGRDVELARRIFAMVGEAFEPVRTEFGELLSGLRDGRWDVTTGMFITPDRMARAAFTRPIWTLADGLLVRRETASEIEAYCSIARIGGKLAVLRGQMQEQTALKWGVKPENLIILENYAEAASAVVSGAAVAYASVELAHREHIAQHPTEDLVCVVVHDEEKPAEPGGFACADSSVRDRLNAALDLVLPATW
jgi:polar amino acid transport system substrate-binding protein